MIRIQTKYDPDGRIRTQRDICGPLWETEGELVVTDEMLAGYAAGMYMPVDAQRLVAAELLNGRNAQAIEAASAT